MAWPSKKGLSVTLDQKDSKNLVFAAGAASGIETVFSNIIENAIQATSDEGRVQVSLWSDLKHVFFVIQDSGKGIPEANLPFLGGMGFTDGKDFGTGLGLYNAIRFVETSGGTLSIRSKINEGTLVEICLPRSQALS